MKKTIIILLLSFIGYGVSAQTIGNMPYDSIKVGRSTGLSGTNLWGRVYLPHTPVGSGSTDSILTILNKRVRKVAALPISKVTGLQAELDSKLTGSISSGIAYGIGGTLTGNAVMTFSNDSTITFRGNKFLQNVSTSQNPNIYSLFIGYGAGANFKLGTQGYANTAVGFGAGGYLQSNIASQASSNSIFGYSAAGGLITGTSNSVFGAATLGNATNINKAIAIGWHTMLNSTSGDESVVVGTYALPSNTANSPHTIIGSLGGYSNTSGKRLTGLGYYALGSNTTGNDNIGIGHGADVYTGSQSIVIGTLATLTGSHKLNIGNAFYGSGIDTTASVRPNFGIGVASPTAGIHIRASDGTLGTAPFKIDQGALLVDKEPGSFEFDGNQIYMTNSASTRQTIAYISDLIGYQQELVSGTNIKTVNSASLLGPGNITTGDALTSNPLSQFTSTTSNQLRGIISDETGTGALMFNSSPIITGGNGNQLVLDNTGENYTQMTFKNNSVTKAAIYYDLSVNKLIAAVGGAEVLQIASAGVQLSGTPTAPTPTAGDNSTKVATTAYVDAAVSGNSIFARTTANDTNYAFGSFPAANKTNLVAFTAMTGNRTVDIPAGSATNASTNIVIVKDESGSGGTYTITITPASGTIDGAASKVINTAYGVVELYSNGSNWFTK